MIFFKLIPSRILLHERFQKIGINNLSEEILIRITAALALVTASVSLDPHILGANTLVGSISLCLGSILNPGYLHRINSIHREYRITAVVARREFKYSLSVLLLLSPLILIFQSEVPHLMIMLNIVSYFLLYATFSYRDIQMARIRERSAPFAASATTFIMGGSLGMLSCLAIFIYHQPAFIPLSIVLAIMPMLMKLSLTIRNTSSSELEYTDQLPKYYTKISAKFALLGMIGSLLMVIDNFIVFGMLTLSELGYYGIAFATVTFIVNVVGTTLQRNEFLKNVGQIPNSNTVLLLTAFILGIFLSVGIFLTASYLDFQVIRRASVLAIILSVGIPFRIRNLHLTVLVEKFGSFNTRVISKLVSITVVLVSGVIAVSFYGLIGMCLASNLSFAFLCAFNKYLALRMRLGDGYTG